MRKVLAVLLGTACLGLGLTACGSSGNEPGGQGTGPAPATRQVGSPEQELDQIGSTLDAIDRELAGDETP
ncbi:hypothetical protein [Kribbella jiaozuonensis]|uniref:Uncharacterized protein n=1 Tax=Kribbella jiaozuonensis TaxID=2575441 RepID=A0A4U3M6Q5_9ACTN|nr:hypothetical protein [Kribbella jiaozuonensis]TKK83117.1 hypothetical protein FDA38_10410 [Kribbella jiaozuonensis]